MKNKKRSDGLHVLWVGSLLMSTSMITQAGLKQLDDHTLSTVTGQSLLSTHYIDPNAQGNLSKLGFYTLGINADIELNTNIKRIQLGCGGVNGQGCDVDLEDVRVAGNVPDATGNYVNSDAKLGQPYIQFAIKNPESAATREVVGLAIGAQDARGMISVGQNPNPTVAGRAGGQTGINSISGNFQATILNLRNPMEITILGVPVAEGNAYVKVTPTQPALPIALPTTENSKIPTGAYYQYISGSRMTGTDLGPIDLNIGNLKVLGLLNLGKISATATYSPINFIDFHNLDITSTQDAGFLLSANSQKILWPQVGTKGIFSFANTSQSLDQQGNITSTGYNSSGKAISPEQLMAQKGWWLSLPPLVAGNSSGFTETSLIKLNLLSAAEALIIGVDVPPVNTGQIPIKNCYGNLNFC